MLFRHGALSRRDAFLLLIGASTMHIWSLFFGQSIGLSDQQHIIVDTHVQQEVQNFTKFETIIRHKTDTETLTQTKTSTQTITSVATPTATSRAVLPFDPVPPTELLAHAPGWTLFRNLYMSEGTLFIVADEKDRHVFPEIRMMTSTGLEAENTPENIAMREPTDKNMRIISPEEARRRWVYPISGTEEKELNRVWSVEGNTLLFNDPKQFLRHYYHFVAELFFGAQAFWHGAFSQPVPAADSNLVSSSGHYSLSHPPAPPIHRAIFAHSNADGWRDDPGFNSYFLRAALPSLTVEHQEDWEDRIKATTPIGGQPERVWHFSTVLLTDRSAAHRGQICGSQTQRTAAEAWDFMRKKGKLRGIHVGGWWAPLREAVWRFAGAEEGIKSLTSSSSASGFLSRDGEQQVMHFMSGEGDVVGMDNEPSKAVEVSDDAQRKLPMPDKVVISYISRQGARNRKLIQKDHEEMVKAMRELVARKNKERKEFLMAVDMIADEDGEERLRKRESYEVPLEWEFNEIQAEKLSKDEQIRQAARTTIMLGVHGNGLTHLVFMKPNRLSTVIEIFYPKGFAHDYYWTSRALGMRHFAIWNDEARYYPNKPDVDYPNGFQGNEIPVDGVKLAKLIEDRVEGKL
ncbi:hypothetical protein CPC08DRAFT_146556 [Agrocybe pediades]|nr:hypothetical protein CPC08DRAFT_146556 [Agrocybe pediades]